ncbi:hypothetical protein [Pseudoalteromonas aurantia]|uniref:hypothetical protein n=1 Tax=Pseudoalteromonas aurantia TaxID=43654 RepID=UPI00110B9ED2|nr:hypothetical protein [Pseudoalteromonas aurantia]
MKFEQSNLYYPTIPELPLLNSFLKDAGLDETVLGIALNITSPHSSMPIHIDTGDLNWSLNVPLMNCDSSRVSFYESKQRPKPFSLPNGVTYLGFEDEKSMVCMDSVSCEDVMIINVKKPHKVVNESDKYRVTLLIRLNSSFSMEDFEEYLSYA